MCCVDFDVSLFSDVLVGFGYLLIGDVGVV